MYESFSLLSIDTVLKEKKIIVSTSLDIDTYEMLNTTIELLDRETKQIEPFTYEVVGKDIVITLNDYPVPNNLYRLVIRNLKSITGDLLTPGINRNVQFDSEILTEVNVLSPSMFEKIKVLEVNLKEFIPNTVKLEEGQLESDLYVNNFYIEIAKDNAFYNPVIKTVINKPSIILALETKGQYYLRARVESLDGSNYGKWCELLTFIMGDTIESGEIPDITDPEAPPVDPDDPIIDLEEFDLETNIVDGTTINKLIILLNKDIAIGSTPTISITRKVVK